LHAPLRQFFGQNSEKRRRIHPVRTARYSRRTISRSSSAEVAAAWLSKVLHRHHPVADLQGLRETVQTALQRVSSDGPDNVVPLRRDQL